MKIHKIPIPVYGSAVYLLHGSTAAELCMWIKKKYGMDSLPAGMESNGYDGRYFRLENKVQGISDFYIWVEKFDWSITSQGILAHEIFHCVMAYLKYFGVEMNELADGTYADEAHAHLFGYLLEEIWLRLRPLSKYFAHQDKLHAKKHKKRPGGHSRRSRPRRSGDKKAVS